MWLYLRMFLLKIIEADNDIGGLIVTVELCETENELRGMDIMPDTFAG